MKLCLDCDGGLSLSSVKLCFFGLTTTEMTKLKVQKKTTKALGSFFVISVKCDMSNGAVAQLEEVLSVQTLDVFLFLLIHVDVRWHRQVSLVPAWSPHSLALCAGRFTIDFLWLWSRRLL